MAINYSILADVELNTKNIQSQLDKVKIKLNTNEATNGLKKLDDEAEEVSLTFQAANEIFSNTVQIISSMVEQVYALNEAQIEFQKVSDLSGEALDAYTAKLMQMGGQVARTGKPKRQAPNVGIVNQTDRTRIALSLSSLRISSLSITAIFLP